MSTRSAMPLVLLAMLVGLTVNDVAATENFAAPAFDQQWRQDEQLTPNFWGPLALAHPGQYEDYVFLPPPCPPGAACPAIAYANRRLVQYFDKGRMELNPNGSLTSGLLVKEMISGQMQTGDNTFASRDPAAIPVAGDLDNVFPLYKDIGKPIPPQPLAAGAPVQTELTPNGPQPAANVPPDTAAAIASTDSATGQPISRIFFDFRERMGTAVVGLAITPPFWVQVRVAGVPRRVLMQAFERRVLTYNAANPDPFKVEFGNVGQHYYRWRYGV